MVPTLPTDPTDEALARDWTLSASDFEEVRRCRGDDNRRRFAIQLCALRAFGCFVDDVGRVPVRIANHVGRQVGVPPALFLSDPDRADMFFVHHAILSGIGLGVLPLFLAEADVARGRITRVFPSWVATSGSLWFVTPAAKVASGAVTAFRGFLVESLEEKQMSLSSADTS